MTRSGNGWCPFAEQIEGVTTFVEGGAFRVGFCDHTANGFYGTLTNPNFWNDSGDSVHFAIARDGRIAQIINIFDTAWAQGRDAAGNSVGPNSPGVTWPPFEQMGKKNPNSYLISTEHEDAIIVNGHTTFVPGSQWTDAQYAADVKVKQWCIEEVKRVQAVNLLRFGIDSLAGHHMFDPTNRRECPGRYWRIEYQSKLYKDLQGDSMKWVSKGKQLVATTDEGLEVVAIGDFAGNFPGRIAKLFGNKWFWLRNDNGRAYWSEEEGD